MNLVIPTNNVNFTDTEGNTILSAPLLDLYYIIAFETNTDYAGKLGMREKMQQAALAVNHEYGSKISWGTMAAIWSEVSEAVEDAKKNSTSTPESQPGTT